MVAISGTGEVSHRGLFFHCDRAMGKENDATKKSNAANGNEWPTAYLAPGPGHASHSGEEHCELRHRLTLFFMNSVVFKW
jgi:hypothetical protein